MIAAPSARTDWGMQIIAVFLSEKVLLSLKHFPTGLRNCHISEELSQRETMVFK